MNKEKLSSNPVLQSFYFSLLEVLGQEKAGKLFHQVNIKPAELSNEAIMQPLAEVLERLGENMAGEFGGMAAQGLFIRTGRASLNYFRRFFPEIADLGSLENRLLPLEKRFFSSLEKLADVWSRQTGMETSVKLVDRLEFNWVMALPEGKKGGVFTSYYVFGLLEDFCAWIDARKTYRIIYTESEEGDQGEIAIAIQSQE